MVGEARATQPSKSPAGWRAQEASARGLTAAPRRQHHDSHISINAVVVEHLHTAHGVPGTGRLKDWAAAAGSKGLLSWDYLDMHATQHQHTHGMRPEAECRWSRDCTSKKAVWLGQAGLPRRSDSDPGSYTSCETGRFRYPGADSVSQGHRRFAGDRPARRAVVRKEPQRTCLYQHILFLVALSTFHIVLHWSPALALFLGLSPSLMSLTYHV